MKILEKQIETLTKRAKKLKQEQDNGKNFYGYSNAGDLEIAIDRLQEAIHYINLTKH